MSRNTWKPVLPALPGTTRYYPVLQGNLRAISVISSDLGHTYHNSVAVCKHLCVRPSLTMHLQNA
eukprot:1365186-Amorphochlora_amoeboformis.AAC.1